MLFDSKNWLYLPRKVEGGTARLSPHSHGLAILTTPVKFYTLGLLALREYWKGWSTFQDKILVDQWQGTQ